MISKRFPEVDLRPVDVPSLNEPQPVVSNPLLMPELMQVIPGITQVNSFRYFIWGQQDYLVSMQNFKQWFISMVTFIWSCKTFICLNVQKHKKNEFSSIGENSALNTCLNLS